MSVTIPRSVLDEYTKQLEMLSDAARKKLTAQLEKVDYTQPDARDRVKEIMQPFCEVATDAAAMISAEFYDVTRKYCTGEPLGAVAESGRVPFATDIAVDGIFNHAASEQGIIDECASRIDYETKRAAANATITNGLNDPKKPRFARVPTGVETCEFCLMLASRGYVYHSAISAGALDHWHANCRCRVVSSWGDKVDGYDPDFYKMLWKNPEKRKEYYEGIVKPPRSTNGINQSAQVYSVLDDKQKEFVSNTINEAPEAMRQLWYRCEGDFVKPNLKRGVRAYYSTGANNVTIDLAEAFEKSKKGYGNTWFHEFGHNIDNLISSNMHVYYSYEYKNHLLAKTLKEEAQIRVKSLQEKANTEFRDKIASGDGEAIAKARLMGLISKDVYKAYENGDISIDVLMKKLKKLPVRYGYSALSNELNAAGSTYGDEYINAVSDIFEGATSGASKDGWGHGKRYWKRDDSLSVEAFAEMYSATVRNGKDLEAIKYYFPKSYDIFLEMCEEAIKA